MAKIRKPGTLEPSESPEKAVYCVNCKNFEQDIIGNKVGSCFGHAISDSNCPLECPYYENEVRIISVLIFLQSGISVYHKAIVRDVSKNLDPQLLSSFLQAINMFGEELAQEQVSQIQFQKMNILICKGNLAYGALIVKGDIDETSKGMFSHFLSKVEQRFPSYFKKEFKGNYLPEKEVDDIAIRSLRKYFSNKMYKISPEIIESRSNLKCAESEMD